MHTLHRMPWVRMGRISSESTAVRDRGVRDFMPKNRPSVRPRTVRAPRGNGDQLPLPMVLDSPLTKAVRADQYLFAYPFFDLSVNGRKTRLVYDDGTITITVKGQEQGIATIFDRDLLLYACALLVEKVEAGEQPSRELVFSARDYFRVAGRDMSGHSYEALEETMDRLKG